MKIGVLIPTYKKPDGSTITHLTRALESVKNQSFDDYKVYLIGDKYEDQKEFDQVSNIIPKNKINHINLSKALEREVYTGNSLWVCGGVNAHNHGVDLALQDGVNYICHLDHDDWYFENHLFEMSNAIESTGTHFLSTFCGGWPSDNGLKLNTKINDNYTRFIPLKNKIFKVTTCVDYKYYKLKMRNMVKEFNKIYASDADLWDRIGDHMKKNQEHGVLINKITCGRGPGKSVLNYY